MMQHRLAFGVLALILGSLALVRPGTAAPDPAVFIGDLGTQGIQVLGPNVPMEPRLARFRQLLQQDFDIPEIGRFVLGRYWGEMTPGQQQEFLGLFGEYLVRAYSDRLGQLDGARFRVTGSTARGDEFLVTSQVDRAAKPPVRIDWHLVERDGGYKITDVDVDGDSMELTQRDAFEVVIEDHGDRADAVLAMLREHLGMRQ